MPSNYILGALGADAGGAGELLADLTIALLGPRQVGRGTSVRFTVAVTNRGPTGAAHVRTALATTGLEHLTASAGWVDGCVQVGMTTVCGYLWSEASLDVRKRLIYTVTGTVTGTVGLVSAVASSLLDPCLADNVAALSVPHPKLTAPVHVAPGPS